MEEGKLKDDDVLIEEPFFESIDKLNEETILNDEIFTEYIFCIESIGKREKEILKLQKKAKQLGVKSAFDDMLKEFKREYLKENKNQKNSIKSKHNEIAEKLLENENIVLYENDLYIYNNGVYSIDKKSIDKKIIQMVPDVTSRFRTEVYQYLQLSPNTNSVNFDRESGIINFKNGLFNLKDKKLYKHSPKFFSINQISTNLNLQAPKIQVVDDVLNRLSCGIYERKQTLLEMIGYCMTTSVKLQKAFVLYGNKAGNGKNTLLNTINELIGRNNISSVSFKQLNTNRFASSIIKNKILNSGTEMPNDYIEDVSKIKEWITGDYTTIEEKGKQIEGIIPYAKFIFNANELPRTGDKTDGFYRRLQIIPLEYSFTSKDVSKFNFNELISREALEYLAKISVEAYLNMNENFTNYKESKREVDKYKIENDSILTFMEDKREIQSFFDGRTRYTKEFYSYYENYCKANDFKRVRKK